MNATPGDLDQDRMRFETEAQAGVLEQLYEDNPDLQPEQIGPAVEQLLGVTKAEIAEVSPHLQSAIQTAQTEGYSGYDAWSLALDRLIGRKRRESGFERIASHYGLEREMDRVLEDRLDQWGLERRPELQSLRYRFVMYQQYLALRLAELKEALKGAGKEKSSASAEKDEAEASLFETKESDACLSKFGDSVQEFTAINVAQAEIDELEKKLSDLESQKNQTDTDLATHLDDPLRQLLGFDMKFERTQMTKPLAKRIVKDITQDTFDKLLALQSQMDPVSFARRILLIEGTLTEAKIKSNSDVLLTALHTDKHTKDPQSMLHKFLTAYIQMIIESRTLLTEQLTANNIQETRDKLDDHLDSGKRSLHLQKEIEALELELSFAQNRFRAVGSRDDWMGKRNDLFKVMDLYIDDVVNKLMGIPGTELGSTCDTFTDDYLAFKRNFGTATSISDQDVKNFLDIFKDFIQELKRLEEAVNQDFAAKTATLDERTAAVDGVDGLTAQITEHETHSRDLLKNAFQTVDPAETRKAQAEFQRAKKGFDGARKVEKVVDEENLAKIAELVTELGNIPDDIQVESVDAGGSPKKPYELLTVTPSIAIKRFTDQNAALIKQNASDQTPLTPEQIDRNNRIISGNEERIDHLKHVEKTCKDLYKLLYDFFEALEILLDLEVLDASHKIAIDGARKALPAANPNKPGFTANKLKAVVNVYYKFQLKLVEVQGFDESFSAKLISLEESKEDTGGVLADLKERRGKKKTDEQAHAALVGQMLDQEFADDLDPTERAELARNILDLDLEILMDEREDDERIKEVTAQKGQILSEGYARPLLFAQFGKGKNTEQPFEDYDMSAFADFENVKKLLGPNMPIERPFLLLAAMLEEEEASGVTNLQRVYLRDALLVKIKEHPRFKGKITKAGDRAKIQDAFNDYLAQARQAYKAYYEYYHENIEKWREHKVRELNLRLQAIYEKVRLEQITPGAKAKQLHDMWKEARKFGVEKSVNWRESPEDFANLGGGAANWGKDFGYNVLSYGGRKGKELGRSALLLPAKGIIGAGGLVGTSALKTAWCAPTRAIAYPWNLVVAKPLAWVARKLRLTKFTPETIRAKAKRHAAEAGGYFKGKKDKAKAGVVSSFKTEKAKFNAQKYKSHDYKERATFTPAELEAEAKLVKENAEPDAIDVVLPKFDLKPAIEELQSMEKGRVKRARGRGQKRRKAA